MLDLLEPNDLVLLQAFESQRICLWRIVSVLYESHSSEGTSTKSRYEIEVVQVEIALLLSLRSSFSFFLGVVPCWNFRVVQYIFRFFFCI